MHTESTTIRLVMRLTRLLLLLFFADLCCAKCSSTYFFTCDDNTCISRIKTCDGRHDCPNGEDESYGKANCTGEPDCKKRNKKMAIANGYPCGKKCDPRRARNCHGVLKRCICDDECGFSCINKDLICPKIPAVRNAVGYTVIRFNGNFKSIVPKGNKYKYGDVLKYNCRPGTTLVGPIPRCTSKRRWSNHLPRCKTSQTPCTSNPCKNGGNCTSLGQTYTCKCPRRFTGNLCETELFCNQPPILPRGYIEDDKGRWFVDEIVTYDCLENYLLVGKKTRLCMKNGTWSSVETKCVRNVCILDRYLLAEGMEVAGYTPLQLYREKFSVGDAISLNCVSGFELSFNGSLFYPPDIRCAFGGNWVPTYSDLYCKALPKILCMDPTSPKHMIITSSEAASQYSVGTTLNVHCELWYQLSGPDSIICQDDGTWSAYPECTLKNVTELPPPKVPCGAPDVPAEIVMSQRGNRSLFDPRERIELQCKAGYRLVGPLFIDCQPDGSWTRLPTCVQTGCSDPSPRFTQQIRVHQNTRKKKFYKTNELIHFSCRNADTYVFSQTAGILFNSTTCTHSGNWDPTPESFDCVHVCKPPHLLENGMMLLNSRVEVFYPNETVFLECPLNFRHSGNNEIRCLSDGRWTEMTPCEPIGCVIDVESIPNSIAIDGYTLESLNEVEFAVGEKILILCTNEDEVLVENLTETVICNVGNTWSSIFTDYQCSNLTCTNRCLTKDGPCGCDFGCKSRNDCCSDFDIICMK